MPTHQILPPTAGISCHAWNADMSMLALCPNNNELHIYEGCHNPDVTQWRRAHVLAEHDLVISGISWSPVTNKIVTCSHDRNAFVWTLDAAQAKWIPTLCVLMIDRAALDVQWSPSGAKFAVGSGSKTVAVSHYDSSQGSDWYISKLIKKHKSSVTQLAWHPNSQVLATACSDFKCRVVSATVPEVDAAPDAGPLGSPRPFGDVYRELSCSGWVTAVAWSPSGTVLAYAGQGSTVQVARFGQAGAAPVEQTVRYPLMPLGRLCFVSEKALVGGGHDMGPLVFSADASGAWSFREQLDQKKEGRRASTEVSQMAAARAMFQAKTTRGQSGGSGGDELTTQHANAITSLQPMGRAGDPTCSKFSTAGMDGRLVVWELPSLNIDLAALGL